MGDLTDVYFANHDTGWIVGTYKIILKTIDGGEHWNKIMNNISDGLSFSSVAFTDDLHGCAVGGEAVGFYQGFSMVTADGGNTWTDTSPTDCDDLEDVIFTDSVTGWACGHNGALVKTTDGGNTWVKKVGQYYNNFDQIHFFDDNNGILINTNSVRLTFDAGETWDSVAPNVFSTFMNKFSSWDNGKGIAVGYAGSMSKTLDGGSTWESISSDITDAILEIGFVNPSNGYAISGHYVFKYLISTTDGGYNWNADTTVENGPFYKMQLTDQSIYLLNTYSQLMKSLDGGESWELLNVPDNTTRYNDIKFANENTGYLCSNKGLLFKTIDGGQTWVNSSLDSSYILSSMFFISEDTGWIIDQHNKLIFKTTNGGGNWTSTSLGDNYIYQPGSVFFINANEGFATTHEGVVFKTTNGGETWEEFYTFEAGQTPKIYFINELEGWYSTSYSVYHTFDGGVTWVNKQTFASMLRSMFFLNDEQGWIGGDHGLIVTSNFIVNVNELNEDNATASVFPNPASNNIEIKLHNKYAKIGDIRIFDMQGKLVMHFSGLSKSNTFKFNVSELISGTYIANVTSSKGESLVKFVVK